jgi:hypothetical protein
MAASSDTRSPREILRESSDATEECATENRSLKILRATRHVARLVLMFMVLRTERVPARSRIMSVPEDEEEAAQ